MKAPTFTRKYGRSTGHRIYRTSDGRLILHHTPIGLVPLSHKATARPPWALRRENRAANRRARAARRAARL